MFKIDYKYNYLASGLNIFAAFVGALEGSLLLIVMCSFFAIWNYYVAENNRKDYENEIRKTDNSEDKE